MSPAPNPPWQPHASIESLRERALLLARIRRFFDERDVLEVETPVLSAAATPDPALASFVTQYRGPVFPQGRALYLHTSPEFPMKRLIAAGSGPIYQICKVFRDGEAGRLHNPEFTMLEWYRPGFDHHRLMSEVEALVGPILGLAIPAERLDYRSAFLRHAGLDPHRATHADFLACARKQGVEIRHGMESETRTSVWCDLLLTHLVEPKLGRGQMTFLYDYPAEQAALARVHPGNPPLAERFELYVEGIELANGFHELGSREEQAMRFARQNETRTAQGLSTMPVDGHFLDALDAGFPDCAGVALGIDRLLILKTGNRRIEDVLAFPLERA